MKTYTKIIISILLILSVNLMAESKVSKNGDIVTINASGEYFMGDSDNKINARTLALTQAKINASEIAGTYIESSFKMTTTNNGVEINKLTSKEIHSFTSAILKTQIKNEKIELSSNQAMIYKLEIEATVDISILQQRIKDLSNDKARKDDLLRLEKENKDLLLSLNKLNNQLKTLESSKQINSSDIKILQDQREYIVNSIIKNEDATKLVFNGKSVINEFEKKKEYAKDLKNKLDILIINNINAYYEIALNEPRILGEDKDNYEVEVSGSVKFLDDKFDKVMYEHFSSDYTNEYKSISVGCYNYSGDKVVKKYLPKDEFPLQIVFSIQNKLYNYNFKYKIGYSQFYMSPYMSYFRNLRKEDHYVENFVTSYKIRKNQINGDLQISAKINIEKIN